MKKILSLVIAMAIVLCGTTVSFAGTPMFENTDSRAVYLYEYPGEQNPAQLKAGEELGLYMMVDKTFSEIHINCPSWSNNVGSMTLSLYKWAGDYSSTVKTQPVAKETYVDFEDNAWLKLKAPNGKFASGEYLWVLSDSVENVGVWKANYDNPDTPIIAESYKNGEPVEGVYVTCIIYAGAVVEAVKVVDKFNVFMYVDSNKAFVKGVEKTLDVPATVINGRTLVPARFVSESIGAVVGWDGTTQTVTITKGDIDIKLVIGSDEMIVNGQVKKLDVPADTINGRTLVPLRAIVEALGEQVNYFPDNGGKGLIVVGPNAVVYSAEKAENVMNIYR